MSRILKNRLFSGISWISLGICCLILVFLIAVIAWNGIKAINFDFLMSESRHFGASGGIYYQIVGSLLMVLVAALISLPLALGTAVYKSEYLKNSKLQMLSDSLIYGLNGIPSIVFGLFGLIFFVNILNTGISWFVGSVILAFMILPTIVLASYQSINSIPDHYRESALALGMDKWRVITIVLLPQGISGAVTGLLIGLARAVGETAPIMFIATAYSGARYPDSLLEPVAALPTHILALAQQATDPDALQAAWGASFVLICLVTLFSISALFIRKRTQILSER